MRILYSLPDEEMQPDYPIDVRVDNRMLWVTLHDGRVIGTPLEWYPWLRTMTLAELTECELSTNGIRWPNHDIDLGIEGMLAGVNPTQTPSALEAAQSAQTRRTNPPGLHESLYPLQLISEAGICSALAHCWSNSPR
jgi:hypothetical protein